MKHLACLIVILSLFLPLFIHAEGTLARLEKKGDIWVLDKGTTHGVKVGLEGYFLHKSYDEATKKEKAVQVAHFKINRVFKVISYAVVDKWTEGYSAKDAQWAQFMDALTPTRSTKATTKKTSGGREVKIESGKDRRWYLVEGEKEFDKGEYEKALKYYQAVLALDAEDPGAKKREKMAKGKLYSQQGTLEYDNGELPAAFEYFLMAFQNLEESEPDPGVAEKILELWDQNPSFASKMKDLGVEPNAIISSVITSCEKLLETNELEKLSKLLEQLKRHTKDEKLKLKLDGIGTSTEIHADLEAKNFSRIMDIIEQALAENNFYKASFIAKRLAEQQMEAADAGRFQAIKDKLAAKEDQIEDQKATLLKEERIKTLVRKAREHVKLNEFDEAIKSYIQIIQLEPGKTEYNKKIKELQMQKFEFQKTQQELQSRLERDSLILRAEDNASKELIQDALDVYIKAYNVFPEDGKALAGMAKLLETCSKEDAAYVEGELLGRKFTKFKKDFLSHMEKNYLGTKDKTGLDILQKITFMTDWTPHTALMEKFKVNLFKINAGAADVLYEKADFEGALKSYQVAQVFQKDERNLVRIQVMTTVLEIDDIFKNGKRKDAASRIAALPHVNRRATLRALGKLSERYLQAGDTKTAGVIIKKIGGFAHDPEIKVLVKELKAKEKASKGK